MYNGNNRSTYPKRTTGFSSASTRAPRQAPDENRHNKHYNYNKGQGQPEYRKKKHEKISRLIAPSNSTVSFCLNDIPSINITQDPNDRISPSLDVKNLGVRFEAHLEGVAQAVEAVARLVVCKRKQQAPPTLDELMIDRNEIIKTLDTQDPSAETIFNELRAFAHRRNWKVMADEGVEVLKQWPITLVPQAVTPNGLSSARPAKVNEYYYSLSGRTMEKRKAERLADGIQNDPTNQISGKYFAPFPCFFDDNNMGDALADEMSNVPEVGSVWLVLDVGSMSTGQVKLLAETSVRYYENSR